MFDGDGGLRSKFVFCTLFLCRSARKVDPAVVTIPRCVVDNIPAAETGEP